MEFITENGLAMIKLDIVGTLALAISLLVFGTFLKKKVSFFDKFCIPGAVIGGLCFAIIMFVCKSTNLLEVSMDTTLQSPFMIAFFTTVGLGASLALVKKGGKLLIIYWLLCGVLAVSQNLIGALLAKVTNINPLLGIMCGAVSMEGGHGGAASFGATIEGLGVNGAVSVGMAAATFGLIFGGLVGGPVARYLIEKYNLKPSESSKIFSSNDISDSDSIAATKSSITSKAFLNHMLIITLCMTFGSVAGKLFSDLSGVVLPGYVGAMFTAVILRNINDKSKLFDLNLNIVELIGDVSLGIFLTMALMNIKLWELANLAGPMIVIVVAQVLFITLFGVFVLFRLLGKDFDAAVMTAGFCGHGLGATPNALANLNSVTQKYGHSTKAFLIVPLVGAFLIDLFGIPVIVAFINFFS